jgi:hypothetical protein
MTPDRPGAPTPDPLLAALLEEAARIDVADLDLDAVEEIVEEIVAPYAGVLMPEALDEARSVAVVAVVSAPDLAERVARHRARGGLRGATAGAQVPESSGMREKQSPGQLLDAARRRSGKRGGKGAS